MEGIAPRTEDEWLACNNPTARVIATWHMMSVRKRRLVGVACCGLIAHLLTDERSWNAMVTAERFAEGVATEKQLQAAWEAVQILHEAFVGGGSEASRLWSAELAARACGFAAAQDFPESAFVAGEARVVLALGEKDRDAAEEDEHRVICSLFRDIHGNPFRPTHSIDPSRLPHNDGAALRLAQAIYEDRAFDRLPDLANALAKAGCRDSEMLGHLRGPGPHVRGGWTVDFLLGMS